MVDINNVVEKNWDEFVKKLLEEEPEPIIGSPILAG